MEDLQLIRKLSDFPLVASHILWKTFRLSLIQVNVLQDLNFIFQNYFTTMLLSSNF